MSYISFLLCLFLPENFQSYGFKAVSAYYIKAVLVVLIFHGKFTVLCNHSGDGGRKARGRWCRYIAVLKLRSNITSSLSSRKSHSSMERPGFGPHMILLEINLLEQEGGKFKNQMLLLATLSLKSILFEHGYHRLSLLQDRYCVFQSTVCCTD